MRSDPEQCCDPTEGCTRHPQSGWNRHCPGPRCVAADICCGLTPCPAGVSCRCGDRKGLSFPAVFAPVWMLPGVHMVTRATGSSGRSRGWPGPSEATWCQGGTSRGPQCGDSRNKTLVGAVVCTPTTRRGTERCMSTSPLAARDHPLHIDGTRPVSYTRTQVQAAEATGPRGHSGHSRHSRPSICTFPAGGRSSQRTGGRADQGWLP